MAMLKAGKRTEIGTRKARALRRQGSVPGIIYGHGEKPLPITLNRHDLGVVIDHGERLLELKIGKAGQNVLVKEVQYDTFGQEILHVDLTRVDLDERVTVTVPIVLRGTPVGVDEEDGVMQQAAPDVEVECRVNRIPEEIRASVTDLHVGDAIHMRDLELPQGASLVSEPEAIVCSVSVVAEEPEAEVEEAEEGAGQPEVIGEKPAEEAEEKGPAGGEGQ